MNHPAIFSLIFRTCIILLSVQNIGRILKKYKQTEHDDISFFISKMNKTDCMKSIEHIFHVGKYLVAFIFALNIRLPWHA